MESTDHKDIKVEEKKAPTARLDRLRDIENKMQGIWYENPEEYVYQNAPEEYHNQSWKEKNDSKYMVTFPYPYMNGYLHLGHAFSMSKAEFQIRYQRQRGKRKIPRVLRL